jgi:putative hydrolase of the HAD superfamily
MNDDRALAVSFDFGQTLADLDAEMLSRRIGERGVQVPPAHLDGAIAAAWRAYNESIKAGLGGHPWKILMARLLSEAGAPEADIQGAVDWLWTEQPTRNLWRRPVPGMIEIVADLVLAGVPVAVISNSEGRLAELIEELGWTARFVVVADSGKLGLEKPDRAIFDWAAERLNVPTSGIVHIGDSYAADVEGALGAGMRAIWFRGSPDLVQSDRVKACADAAEVRAALDAWGIKLG